jgi:hypothetical protein
MDISDEASATTLAAEAARRKREGCMLKWERKRGRAELFAWCYG